jgi:hypothetical protein
MAVQIDLGPSVREMAGSIRAELERGVERAAAKGARAATAYAKSIVRVDTGRLRREIEFRPLAGSRGDAQWEVVSATPYAWFVEHPTKAHWIHPRSAYNAPRASLAPGQKRQKRHETLGARPGGGMRKMLRWWSGGRPGAGRPIFARKVYHPGTPGFPFIAPAGSVAEQVMQAEIDAVVERVATMWG